MDFSKVVEKTKEPYFVVRHKLLWVPREDYEKVLKSYVDPYTEKGAQEFVAKYLSVKGDPGLVGLVGLQCREKEVLLDAAVRYDISEEK